jgi:hypothetical protein
MNLKIHKNIQNNLVRKILLKKLRLNKIKSVLISFRMINKLYNTMKIFKNH